MIADKKEHRPQGVQKNYRTQTFSRSLSPVFLGACVLCVLWSASFALFASAQTQKDLELDIANHNKQIAELDKEIAEYEHQLTETGTQKQTLQNTVNTLEIQQKQLRAKIRSTKNKIGALELKIQELSRDIGEKEALISHGVGALGASIRSIDKDDHRSFAETVLGGGTISYVWEELESVRRVQTAVRENVAALHVARDSLAESKTESEMARKKLSAERQTLSAQEQSLTISVREQKNLLAQTKEKESTFQELLEEKRMAKIAFENALAELESKLEYTYDPSAVPRAGGGILRWPLDNVKITQYFGNTQFARSGAYSGRGHNGIDFRAAIGTPVKATLTGVVEGTGNTDEIPRCYSYGKWVLIRHSNGLTTLYAHLSHISVRTGDVVATGGIIGYSGFTGYATGPHLHFSVYASNGVKIMRLADATGKSTPCANAIIPLSPLSAYLNPMDYLQ